ncbi:MAG: hypothetical protein PVG54_04835 [Anaerolineae bacterium]
MSRAADGKKRETGDAEQQGAHDHGGMSDGWGGYDHTLYLSGMRAYEFQADE